MTGLPSGYLAAHPLPPGIAGALSLGGYGLLVDIAGVGAGRLGSQVFLLAAADPEPSAGAVGGADGTASAGAGAAATPGGVVASPTAADPGTQISLHQSRLRDEREAAAFVALAAQIGLLRMSGHRLVLERAGLRSKIALVDPATGAIALQIPEKHPGRLFGGGGGSSAAALLAAARALPAAGPPPDTSRPELVRDVLLALALRDDSLGGAEAAELADRALPLTTGPGALDPAAALEAARRSPP